ncbi:TIGR04086 family membrane protein [Clostridium sp. MSJ-8]|uniref:TIGR04086 family membrane protein n=1 Tax=Clostridium sp. MSJ-8 TaxID=2841510 RepID=UPI001C0F363B|nr:TIGR04086 family membrane protein [Clostridium sp. MSJ-8]MBU5487129.1 TIGR04086 family membrane protein [Clostridium sp. MSJ-8]
MNEKKLSRGIIKGSVISIIFFGILLLIISILMMIFDFSKVTYKVMYSIISNIALISGAFIAAKINKRKGLVTGLIVGIIFYIFLSVVSFLIKGDMSVISENIYTLVLSGVIGLVSGILGVNI